MGRIDFNRELRASRVSIGIASAAARSTQPTTPLTTPSLFFATLSRNSVSDTVGAAWTSTVVVTPAASRSGARSASEKSR